MQISVSQKIAQISAGVTRFVSHLRFEIFLCFLCFRCEQSRCILKCQGIIRIFLKWLGSVALSPQTLQGTAVDRHRPNNWDTFELKEQSHEKIMRTKATGVKVYAIHCS